jgi:hypothetical protein
MEWISVKDRLPELKDKIYFTDGYRRWHGFMDEFIRHGTNKDAIMEFFREGHARPIPEITHWRKPYFAPPTIDFSINLWISVKDRLPDKDVDVLIFQKDSSCNPDIILSSLKENGYWFSPSCCEYENPVPTHWMPLPIPPE